jgi:hypothetical protein
MNYTLAGRFLGIPACVLFVSLVFSCAGTPAERLPDSGGPAAGPAPERPSLPEAPRFIMGKGLVDPHTLAAFLMSVNSEAEKAFVRDLAAFYVEEGTAEGVNHDAAFAQMCLETGFLRFGGLVKPEMNNFCGLGSIGPGQPGEKFPNPRIGVRAHIQHLKAYATTEALHQELVDPRYRWVRYGASPEIKGLAGTWAADPGYAEKINSILTRLYDFSFKPEASS